MKANSALRVATAGLALMVVISMSGCASFRRARDISQARNCQENLTKIDGSTQQWALEKNKGPNDVPTWT